MKRALLVLATLLAVGSPAVAQQKPAPAPGASSKVALQDRVLAVVDDDPILDSDVQRVVRLGLAAPKPGEGDEAFRRRLLNELIEQRLQFHEIDRFGFEQVPVDEIEKRVAAIRARFPDDAAFQKALREVGLDPKRLRQLVARQLLVLTYVDERLGPSVFVTPEDISRYYREVLTPEMQKRGQPAPPLDDVRDDIRETLKQQKITAEMTRWTQGLREKADIVAYPATQADRPLPPVVKTIRGTQKPQTPASPAPQKKSGAKKPPLPGGP